MNNINFYGKSSETTGSIGNKSSDSSINETTGSIGYHSFSAPNISKSLPKDSVSFQGYENYKEKNTGMSFSSVALDITGLAALAILGCGYAQKTNSINKIKNPQLKKILTKISEPCYKLCSNIKQYSIRTYNKLF